MPLGLGIAKGASYVNDWEKDIDRVYQRAEYAAKIQSEKERKTAYYAELLKKGHATNPRAEGELNEFYKGLNNELATFVTENPTFETDIDAMQKFNDIKDKYLNNDILRRDIQVGQEHDKLRQAVSSGQLLPEEAEAEAKKYDDYINMKSNDPYVFTNYKEIDLDKIAMETARAVINVPLDGTEGRPNTRKKDPDTQNWFVDVATDPIKLRQAAESTYNDPRTNMAIKRRFAEVMKNPANADLYKGEGADLVWWNDYLKTYGDLKKTDLGRDFAAQKALSDANDVTTDYAFDGKVKRLIALSSQKDANGNFIDGGTDPSVEADMALTDWGTEAKSIITNGMGAKALVNGKYRPFSFGAGLTAKQLSTSQWISIGGVPHLEVNIQIENPQADGENYTKRKAELDKYGFTQEEAIIGFGIDMGNKQVNGLMHSGKVYLPLSISQEKMINWTKQYGQKAVDYVGPKYAKQQEEISGINAENKHRQYDWTMSEAEKNAQEVIVKNYNDNHINKIISEVTPSELGNLAPYEKGRYYIVQRPEGRFIYDRLAPIGKEYYPTNAIK